MAKNHYPFNSSNPVRWYNDEGKQHWPARGLINVLLGLDAMTHVPENLEGEEYEIAQEEANVETLALLRRIAKDLAPVAKTIDVDALQEAINHADKFPKIKVSRWFNLVSSRYFEKTIGKNIALDVVKQQVKAGNVETSFKLED